MAKTKPAPAQLSREDKLKILKKAKLYSGTTKIDKGKASGAQKRALAQFKNDIPLLAAGRAKSVSVGKAKRAQFQDDLKPRRGRVVVHVESPDEKVRFNKNTGRFTGTVKSHGVTFRRIIFANEKQLLEYKPTKNTRYQVPFRQWGVMDSPLFENFEDLQAFMATYEEPIKKNGKLVGGDFPDWLKYVEVLELEKRPT